MLFMYILYIYVYVYNFLTGNVLEFVFPKTF